MTRSRRAKSCARVWESASIGNASGTGKATPRSLHVAPAQVVVGQSAVSLFSSRREREREKLRVGAVRQADAAELRAALRLFAPSVAARADEVWRTHVAPSAPSGAFFVALYHRVAAREAQYRACLPGRAFYVAARARLRSHVDATHGAGTPIVWLTSSYEFGDRAAIDTLLGAAPDDAAREPLLALDDLDGSVVMATLARANASTFSFGTFSWWTAFLTGGPVLYDASLRDTTSLEVSGCAELTTASPPRIFASFLNLCESIDRG